MLSPLHAGCTLADCMHARTRYKISMQLSPLHAGCTLADCIHARTRYKISMHDAMTGGLHYKIRKSACRQTLNTRHERRISMHDAMTGGQHARFANLHALGL